MLNFFLLFRSITNCIQPNKKLVCNSFLKYFHLINLLFWIAREVRVLLFCKENFKPLLYSLHIVVNWNDLGSKVRLIFEIVVHIWRRRTICIYFNNFFNSYFYWLFLLIWSKRVAFWFTSFSWWKLRFILHIAVVELHQRRLWVVWLENEASRANVKFASLFPA